MQHEGCEKAAKVDENVAKWTKICRSTVNHDVSWKVWENCLYGTILWQDLITDKPLIVCPIVPIELES